MIVLDAYAVIAFLRDEHAGPLVERLLRGDEPTTLSALSVAEVVDRLVRLYSADDEERMATLVNLGLVGPPPLDADLARQAGLLRARHYHRRTRTISLADCVAAETARRLGASLATADPALLDTCAAEGIDVIPAAR